jgi:hypothetical protein
MPGCRSDSLRGSTPVTAPRLVRLNKKLAWHLRLDPGTFAAPEGVEIPTTRALAAVTTGEQVWRETPLPGAVLTRVASSHIRVGTFQFFAARGDLDAIVPLQHL